MVWIHMDGQVSAETGNARGPGGALSPGAAPGGARSPGPPR
jgi:hypothetical protein